jgi:AraC-like DNA-binding protein|tara:strand:+ start:164 stop:778 length:615 start_codon:yes stop_codon:yes gene_type:complete
MSQDRNIKWLNDRRIVYRRDPINDKPTIKTKQYEYYEDGTYECYNLFNSKAKITTYRSLKWHFLVLYYLNEDNSVFIANYVFKYIADKENGFVTFFIKDKILNHMINNVIEQGGNPPKNKIRKVIFKDNSGLNINKKLSIVGQLVGRKKITEEQIYEYMLDLAHVNKKITIKLLADLLKCSSRTVHRNMSKELKHEKQKLNEKI